MCSELICGQVLKMNFINGFVSAVNFFMILSGSVAKKMFQTFNNLEENFPILPFFSFFVENVTFSTFSDRLSEISIQLFKRKMDSKSNFFLGVLQEQLKLLANEKSTDSAI